MSVRSMSFQTSRPRMPVRTTSKAEVLPPGWQIAPDKRFTGCAFLLKSERKYPGIPLGESVAIQPVIEKQNHTVKNFGTVRSEEHTSELQSLTNLVCRLL